MPEKRVELRSAGAMESTVCLICMMNSGEVEDLPSQYFYAYWAGTDERAWEHPIPACNECILSGKALALISEHLDKATELSNIFFNCLADLVLALNKISDVVTTQRQKLEQTMKKPAASVTNPSTYFVGEIVAWSHPTEPYAVFLGVAQNTRRAIVEYINREEGKVQGCYNVPMSAITKVSEDSILVQRFKQEFSNLPHRLSVGEVVFHFERQPIQPWKVTALSEDGCIADVVTVTYSQAQGTYVKQEEKWPSGFALRVAESEPLAFMAEMLEGRLRYLEGGSEEGETNNQMR